MYIPRERSLFEIQGFITTLNFFPIQNIFLSIQKILDFICMISNLKLFIIFSIACYGKISLSMLNIGIFLRSLFFKKGYITILDLEASSLVECVSTFTKEFSSWRTFRKKRRLKKQRLTWPPLTLQ